MIKIRHIYLFFLALSLFSCKKNDQFGPQSTEPEHEIIFSSNAVFLINEGNFGSNNGSLSYINLDSLTIANNIFQNRNNRYLGDVPQSVSLIGDFIYISVNHSAKIEILKAHDLSWVKTLEGFKSPRYICHTGLSKAYISELYSDSLAIIDLNTNTILDYINIGRSSDKMLLHNNIVYVLNWSNYGNPGVENNQVVKINATNDQIEGMIQVAKEPNSIVLDRNGKLWILCSGGYDNLVNPELLRINPHSDEIELRLVFQDISSSPTCLSINNTGDTLYFINNDIFELSINESVLPNNSLIDANGSSFYNMTIHSDKVILCDVKNYSTQGQVYIYKKNGQLIKSLDAGIIPGDISFY